MQLICKKEEQERRNSICSSCEHKNGNKCGICGCYLLGIRKWYAPMCPLKKFDIVKDEK